MSYTPYYGVNGFKDWPDVRTPVTADFLNKLEDGVAGIGSGFSVLAYGAKGDGTTSDTAAFQAANDAASAAGGGTVYVPDATYLIPDGTTITGSSNVHWRFGANAIVTSGPVSGNEVMFIWNAQTNFSVVGGKFFGSYTSSQTEHNHSALIANGACSNFQFNDNNIWGWRGKGIFIQGTNDNTGATSANNFQICRNFIHDFASGNAISLDLACSDFICTDNQMINNFNAGIGHEALISGANIRWRGIIANNSASAWGKFGLGAMVDCVVANNTVKHIANSSDPAFDFGDNGLGMSNVTVTGNAIDCTLTDSFGAGMRFTNVTGGMTGCTITSNTIICGPNNGAGIDLRMGTSGGTNNACDGNTIIAGGIIVGTFTDSSISGNVFDGSLQCQTTCARLTVDGNRGVVAPNQWLIGGSDNVVNDNAIQGSSTDNTAALVISGGSNVIVSGNRISHNAGNVVGVIQLVNAVNCLVTGNRCDNANGGNTNTVSESGTCSGNKVLGNYFTDASGSHRPNLGPSVTSTGSVLRNNEGVNPVGNLSVAVPSTTNSVAASPYDRWFYVTASSLSSSIVVDGTTTVVPALTCVPVFVPASFTLTPTYSAAPTWTVQGL